MRSGGAARLLVVANRLPVSVRAHQDGVRVGRASGGLATGLRSWQEQSSAVWVGWPGDVSRMTVAQREALDRKLAASNLVPVHLTVEEIDRYYEGFANQVLWPLCHYLVDRVPVDASGWAAYRAANARFAQVVVDAYQPGDLIWVHDYQLMLLPGMLRERLPDARIGFFHHIPFPSSEVFRILPWRRELLEGLLGADLVGFHTYAYRRHFLTSLLHVAGIEAEVDTVRVGERTVQVGVFAMGIDAQAFDARARSADVRADVARLREDAGGRRIVLGVDRLDYTKGIPRRLHAFERLLARRPDLRDTVRYVQVAVPSREGVDSYRTFRRQVNEIVGRINGACATLTSTPVHYLHRSVSQQELVALYGAADVMLVTPLRDGMNLVAKEFVASRQDGDGVLVLSEFAGAAAELGDAVVVNPYDVDAVSQAIERGLEMPEDDRRARMGALRRQVFAHDVHAWATSFVDQLDARPAEVATAAPAASALQGADVLAAVRGRPVCLLLDYDGTLAPIVATPELAAPDADLWALLEALSRLPHARVHIVSGRSRDTLQQWLGVLPLDLWAEHGFWHRPALQQRWVASATLPEDWWVKVLPILESFTSSTPGSRIETKTAALAWHYRLAEDEFGARQAHELRMVLGDALSNQPLEVLEGKKVVEVRLRGVSKAAAARHALSSLAAGTAVLAIGDDRTDEDLFTALPEDALTVRVGEGASAARHRVADVAAVRALLRQLAWAGTPAPRGA
jgi:trehalose 6-phosphate synthase/phosphatase